MCSETLIQNTTNDAKLKAALGRANLTPFDSIDPRVLLSSEDLAAEVAAAQSHPHEDARAAAQRAAGEAAAPAAADPQSSCAARPGPETAAEQGSLELAAWRSLAARSAS